MKNYTAEEMRAIALERNTTEYMKELELATNHYEITVQGAILRNAQKRKITLTVPANINKRMLMNAIKEDGYKVEKVYETKKRFLRKAIKVETDKLFIQW